MKRGGVLCGDHSAVCGEGCDVMQMEESTLYTMQYVISSRIEKLYSFTVSAKVLQELQQVMRDYLHRYLGHSFQSLKILEEMDSLAVEIVNPK